MKNRLLLFLKNKNKHSFCLSLLFILLFSISPNQQLKASDALGTDLTYECLGNNQYLVQLAFFRDCNGAVPLPSLSIQVTSESCNYDELIIASIINTPQIITPICPTEPDACETTDGVYGIEEWVYESILTLPESCNDWVLHTSICCRNQAITNIINPEWGTMDISTAIDNTLADCNNSPQFLNDPAIITCVGQPINYNHGAIDSDGDELVFSLVDCKEQNNNSVNYIDGLSSSMPFNAEDFQFDSQTGAVSFTSTVQQVGIICILVEEFRDGVKIGEVTRDMQFTIRDCDNNLPTLSPIPQTNSYTIQACPETLVSFTLTPNDEDVGSVITLHYNNAIPNATLTTNPNTPYDGIFNWTPTVDDIGTHNFTVTVEDDACPLTGSNVFSYTIIVNAELFATLEYQEESCINACDGTIDITMVECGTPPYSYLWSNGATTEDINNLCEGTYTVIITDATNAKDTQSVTLLESGLVLETTANIPSCASSCIASIDLSVDCGTPPYSFLWSNGSVTEDQFGLCAGQYTVTVTDNFGKTDTTSFLIAYTTPQINLVSLNSNGGFDFTCAEDMTGSIQAQTTNGLAPFTYLWNNGMTTDNLQNLGPGAYTVSITDANNCTVSSSIVLSPPPLLLVTLTSSDMSCNETQNGSITTTPSGGVPPYSYSWNNGQSTASISNLVAGSYTVVISDANNCNITESVTIEQIPAILFETLTTPELCEGDNTGQIELTNVINGTSPFQYSLNGGTAQTSPIFDQLVSGSYTILVEDAIGCQATTIIDLEEPPVFSIDLEPNVTIDLGCEHEIEASYTASSGLTYTWDNGATLSCSDCPNPIAIPLETTTYTVTIQNENACTLSSSTTIEVNKKRSVAIPNAFSPNADGLNDELYVLGGKDVKQVNLFQVYNRWGQLVFERQNVAANDASAGWDGLFKGKAVNMDTYVYKAEVQFLDDVVEAYHGDVVLLR